VYRSKATTSVLIEIAGTCLACLLSAHARKVRTRGSTLKDACGTSACIHTLITDQSRSTVGDPRQSREPSIPWLSLNSMSCTPLYTLSVPRVRLLDGRENCGPRTQSSITSPRHSKMAEMDAAWSCCRAAFVELMHHFASLPTDLADSKHSSHAYS
jgi:hypothetical protein